MATTIRSVGSVSSAVRRSDVARSSMATIRASLSGGRWCCPRPGPGRRRRPRGGPVPAPASRRPRPDRRPAPRPAPSSAPGRRRRPAPGTASPCVGRVRVRGREPCWPGRSRTSSSSDRLSNWRPLRRDSGLPSSPAQRSTQARAASWRRRPDRRSPGRPRSPARGRRPRAPCGGRRRSPAGPAAAGRGRWPGRRAAARTRAPTAVNTSSKACSRSVSWPRRCPIRSAARARGQRAQCGEHRVSSPTSPRSASSGGMSRRR